MESFDDADRSVATATLRKRPVLTGVESAALDVLRLPQMHVQETESRAVGCRGVRERGRSFFMGGEVERFGFADAWWFSGPLRALTIVVIVFTLLSLTPALTDGTNPDHVRAIVGIGVLALFVLGAAIFVVSVADSYVEVDDDAISVRFESFFRVRIPLADVGAVRVMEAHPRWRFRWGLATNFRDRISCSHGGRLVEIEMATPLAVRLWPRTLMVERFWLGVPEHAGLVRAIEGRMAAHVDVRVAA